MATPNIVPRAAGEGGLGTSAKGWGGGFITNTTTSSASEGGKLVLAADDGAVMASGHRLGVIEFKGAEDTGHTLTIGARIEALTDDTWSASENGASLKFYTTDANASESLVLTLDSDKLATFAGQAQIDGASLKIAHNANDYATFTVADTGDLTIATVGDGSLDSDLTLDVDGDIEFNADGGNILFKDDSTSLVSIDSTGALRSLNYRTLYIDAGSMVPQVTNGATAGTEEASTNDVMNDYYAFDATTTEYVQFKTVLPEQWDAGTIKAKFYWKPLSSTTTSHTVVWQVQATAAADGGTIDSSWGTVQQTTDDVLGTAAGRVHLTAATPATTVAGSPSTGSDNLVYFRVLRPSGSVAADDLTEDAHLLGVLIQYKESLTTDSAW